MDIISVLTALLALAIIALFTLTINSLVVLRNFKAIPGPHPRLPIIGNLLKFYRPEIPLFQLMAKIFDEFWKAHKEDGMFLIFFGSQPVLYLFKPEYVADFLKDNSLISKPTEYDLFTPWLGKGLVTSNGMNWKNKRRLLNPAFHSKILEEYIPTMNEESIKLIQKLRKEVKDTYIDIRSLMKETTLNIISKTAMGTSLEEKSGIVNEYKNSLDRIPTALVSRIYNPFNWSDFIFYRRTIGKQLLKDVKAMNKFTQDVINERKMDFKPGLNFEDSKRMVFLDLLLTLQSEDNSIRDEDIRDDVTTFMFAGHDTSSSCLMWTLLFLGNYQECQKKVIQELNAIFGDDRQRDVNKDDINHMQYIECVIKETLRLYPSVPFFGRVTTNDVKIGEHQFPKGTSVIIPIINTHKDEDSFPNAYEFIPERFENLSKSQLGYSPFALGPRNCIGQRFGMMEMKVILAHIFRNFSIKCLDKETDVKICVDVTLKALSPIRISFQNLQY